LPRRLSILSLVVALLSAACGSTRSTHSTHSAHSAASAASAAFRPRAQRNATLVLDFTPNAVHTGIYAALAHGYDRAQSVDLHVVAPSASTDSIKLLETGRADFAILDLHDLAIARQQGEPIKAIMAIVERPLAAVIAGPQVRNPRQLQGRTVGVTGVPSDTAVLRSIVAGSGGRPAAVKQLVIGFDAVPDLIAGRVAAVTSFWNDEGVTLQRRDRGVHIFRVDQFGAPSYPELVLCATGSSLRADPGLARSVVRALVAGYRLALAHPAAAAASLESRVAGLDPKLVSAELAALRPAFAGPDGRVGELNLGRLRSWATWEARFGIVRRPPDVAGMFAPGFVPGP
jgi:putative hydroxymethylpyrimidine transport system substrate-binding protein